MFDGKYKKSTFNSLHTDRNPLMCSREGGKRGINDFKFGTFIVRFKSDSAASVTAKGLNLRVARHNSKR